MDRTQKNNKLKTITKISWIGMNVIGIIFLFLIIAGNIFDLYSDLIMFISIVVLWIIIAELNYLHTLFIDKYNEDNCAWAEQKGICFFVSGIAMCVLSPVFGILISELEHNLVELKKLVIGLILIIVGMITILALICLMFKLNKKVAVWIVGEDKVK